ncbi:MAG: DegV family protein [Chloroflexota bacterium]
MSVGIVTDSTNCLPAEIIKEYNIKVAPVHLIIEGKDYRDGVDITTAEFWEMFPNLKSPVSTGGVGPADYLQAFNELAPTNDSILCISLSKVLSVTYKSAEQAIADFLATHPKHKVELIDSKTAVGALGLIALEAARAARAGKGLAEVAPVARDLIPRAKFLATLDTLKYLIRIGRAPKKAVIGQLAGVKPIIGIVNNTGLIDNLGRERGKQKALRRMVDMVSQYADTSRPLHVTTHYSNNIEDGEQVKAMMMEKYHCAEVYVTEMTPVVAAALGPVVGVCFYS